LNPMAVRVMEEAGIDISGHISKTTSDLGHREFDYVITVCDNANETCPYFPARTKVVHRSFQDPPKLAEAATSDEERLPHYRRVRDEIQEFVSALPEILELEK
ncbi:MAG: arsenate reductase ArsC, partial [Candidatus Aegiribacteria sp.]|nr:arsenate reductase ArsC [Candidatus Aegiribacteria sp.]MBD3294345.1 arsenate reductase ArsC [Candidatus Fermentibacteria bacterium]